MHVLEGGSARLILEALLRFGCRVAMMVRQRIKDLYTIAKFWIRVFTARSTELTAQ